MKAFGYVFSLLILGLGCGQVQEKEVKLEMLPEGETNASYASSTATTEDEESEEETPSTTTELTPLQKVQEEIESKRSVSACGNSSGCTFDTSYSVVNAVVTAVKPCTSAGGKCGSSGSARTGIDWIYAQEIGGGGVLLNPFGWTTASTTSSIKVGDKISFTPTHFRFIYGRGYVLKIDESTLTVTSATAPELFQVAAEILDLDSIDFSKQANANFYRMVSGTVKVNSAATTITVDTGGKWYTLNTKGFPTDAGFYLRGSSSTLVKDKCYTLKNLALIWTITPPTAGYAIDVVGFDFTNTSYGMGSITETDCAAAGL
jgi:hypothetical protein